MTKTFNTSALVYDGDDTVFYCYNTRVFDFVDFLDIQKIAYENAIAHKHTLFRFFKYTKSEMDEKIGLN